MSRVGGPTGRVSPSAWAQAETSLAGLKAQREAAVAQMPEPAAPPPAGWRSAARELGLRLGLVEEGVTPAQVEAATAKVAEIDAIMGPMQSLAKALRQRAPKVETMSGARLSEVARDARARLEDLGALRAALDAAGPAVASYFPTAQLDALETKLQSRIEGVRDEGAARAQATRRAQLADIARREKARVAEELQRRGLEDPRLAGRRPEPARAERTERAAYSFRREPPPIPEAVLLKTSALADGAAAGAKIAELLAEPALGRLAAEALAAAEGPQRAQLEGALKGYAALADFATGSPDYARTGVSMFGAPRCRRSHQARDYGRTAQDSAPRQQESRRTLARVLQAALTSEAPAAATERALTQQFLAEIGVPERASADWAPTPKAVTQALDDELFVPLRALNETIQMARSRAPRRAMLDAVREATQAVVEGRYADWKHTRPTSQAQIAHLDEAGQQTWLGTERRETKGQDGRAYTTREAEGHEAFWATKVGGPSHAFDTMNWCILSLLGNARTKAIQVGDADWHQPAGRAYLRLMKDRFDNPVVFLDNLEVDFPYRDRHHDRRGDLAHAALEHAMAKAKALGAGLAVASDVHRLARHGIQPQPFPGELVLEPSGMVVEAADTYGPGHDWDQRERMAVHTRAAYVPPETIAAWNG